MDIRFVRPEEAEQLSRNIVSSFPSKTPPELLENLDSELHTPLEGRYLGCFDDNGTLIGSLMMMDFAFNVRGVMMPMGAAAYVSTNFLHKKEKIACTLLKVLMNYYAETDTPIGCLHPFNPAFYGKMGYGYCNENILYMPKPCYIRSFGDKSGLSYATEADRAEILDFYRRYAKRTNGATIHRFMDPYRIFQQPYVVVCRRGGRITGYLTYEFVEVDHYTDMYHDLYVHEMIYDDLETLQQFMTFFASQTDQIDRVRILSTDEYLHMMFTNPDSGENLAHDGCIQEIGRRTMGCMVRIFDVPGYFKQQTHCSAPVSRNFVLSLEVHDPFLSRNCGTYYLDISGQTVTLVEHARPDVTLTTGIGELSSLVMGAYPLEQAAALGRVSVSDASFIPDIQRAIGWDKKPVNITYF